MTDKIPEHPAASSTGEDDFMSLADLVRMVWRHRLGILVFTIIITSIVAGITLVSPRPYEASAAMEVMPEYSSDGRVDKDRFETQILTQLETAKSPAVGMRVMQSLNGGGRNITFPELMQDINVSRPPKTSVINVKIILPSSDLALQIVKTWRDEAMLEVQRKTMEKALIFVRGRLKDMQEEWLKCTAALNEARRAAGKLENDKLITVTRSVDDTVLWQDLVKKSDDSTMNRISDLNLKSQEMNQEYLDARNRLAEIEQKAAGAILSRNFYQNVVDLLESRLDRESSALVMDVADDAGKEALIYVNALTKSKEVLALGDPVVYRSQRGAMKKTIMAGFASMFIACMIAFIYEWARQVGLE